jgi:hypothetical protein
LGTTSPERVLTQPGEFGSTPRYTAQMGHWSEGLLDETIARIGGEPDPGEVRQALRKSSEQIEVLAGRRFGTSERRTARLNGGGLPFIEVPDLQIGTADSDLPIHPVPDPVNPILSSVLQFEPLFEPVPAPASITDALFHAGRLVATAARMGLLTRDFVIRCLGDIDPQPRMELLREVMDPHYRCAVPVVATSGGGWWFQLTRRLVWVTNETPDEGRLLEPLFDREEGSDRPAVGLAAYEPVLVVVRMSEQPARWAFTARIWTQDVEQPFDRPWADLSKAIRGHGVPIVTVDPQSTPLEVACQVVLLGYWHHYVSNDEPGLANALAAAYPRQVDRVRRGTASPDPVAAAAILLEGLLHPGFDPARGAEATRRYVTRKANIAVMEHRKLENQDSLTWTRLGISERRFYKLLPRFAEKAGGRYQYDSAEVGLRMHAFLVDQEKSDMIRNAATAVLLKHGFRRDAARKWLQRHAAEQAVDAWPRGGANAGIVPSSRQATGTRR